MTPARIIVSLALVAMSACSSAAPSSAEIEAGAVDVPVACASIEESYEAALHELGGCPGYLFRAEWCEPARACVEAPDELVDGGAFWVEFHRSVPTCRELYWARGGFCGGVRASAEVD